MLYLSTRISILFICAYIIVIIISLFISIVEYFNLYSVPKNYSHITHVLVKGEGTVWADLL